MHNNEELLTNPWFLLAATILGVVGLFQLAPHFFVALSVLAAVAATLACFIASFVSFFDERIGAGIALLILTPITALVTGGIAFLVDKAAEEVDRERSREKKREAERQSRIEEELNCEVVKNSENSHPGWFTYIWIISSSISVTAIVVWLLYNHNFVVTKDSIYIIFVSILILPLFLFLPAVYIAAIVEWLTKRANKA